MQGTYIADSKTRHMVLVLSRKKPLSAFKAELTVGTAISQVSSQWLMKIQNDQSNAGYYETSLSTVNAIGRFAFSFFCDGTRNLKATVIAISSYITVYMRPGQKYVLSYRLRSCVNSPTIVEGAKHIP